MALLSLLDVSHAFGGPPVLDHVNFQVNSGERVCLLGRNGAGKSTLMKLIVGEIKSDTGQVFRQPGAHFARLVQEVPADLTGSVHDIVSAGLRSASAHEEDWEREVRLEDLINHVGLDSQAEFSALSGGLKRRVLLAQALASISSTARGPVFRKKVMIHLRWRPQARDEADGRARLVR
jgi:ATP-binding cassette subfamily F protein uup